MKIFIGLIIILFFSCCNNPNSRSLETERDNSQVPVPVTGVNEKNNIDLVEQQDSLFSLTGKDALDSNSNSSHFQNNADQKNLRPSHEEDTIRMLSFFGHEVSDLPKRQEYWKVLKIDEGLYRREGVRLENISSTTHPNQYVLSAFSDEPLEFIYTGLTACDEVINADDRKKNLQDGDSILIQNIEQVKVFMLYSNDQLSIVTYGNGRSGHKHPVIKLKDFSEYNSAFGGLTTSWIGDIDCDNLNEIIIHFEIGNTIHNWTLKTQDGQDYKVLTKESMYWD